MFGSFEPEEERVRYGLTKNIKTFHPVKVAYGEYMNIWRDVRAADGWQDRFGYAFRVGLEAEPIAAKTIGGSRPIHIGAPTVPIGIDGWLLLIDPLVPG